MKRALSFVLLMALLVPMVATETFAIGPSTAPNNASMTIAEFTNAYQLDVAASNFGLSSATSGNREGELEISFDYYTGDGTTKYSKTYSVTGSYYCTVTRP